MSYMFNDCFRDISKNLINAGYLNEPQAEVILKAYQESHNAGGKLQERVDIHTRIEQEYFKAIESLNQRLNTWSG